MGVDGLAKTTKYRVTWGDGTFDVVDSYQDARKAMTAQKTATKRRGMRVTSISV